MAGTESNPNQPRSEASQVFVGVDTGGTFTDLLMVRDGAVSSYKLPSTPADPSRAVLEGTRTLLDTLDSPPPADGEGFTLVHSSTVATNALLERRGVKTGLISTRGFGDVIEIGRQTRPSLYNLYVERPDPLVPRACRGEVDERVDAQGKALTEPERGQIEAVLDAMEQAGVQSLAVCLLFSFLKPKHEKLIAAAARKRGLSVSRSSQIAPEFREYERTSTTVVNAYVSPLMSRYIDRLSDTAKRLGAKRLRIVQSNGGSLAAKTAGDQAVHTLLSGPAAGVIGALALARQAFSGTGRRRGKRAGSSGQGRAVNLITFDMGGTSTDVSLLPGDYRLSSETSIGGCPVRVPMLDIHTVGAGGGSLAWLDAGGAMRVGPRSAGADPGPACYGRGEQPAVTDANLVLGRLDAEHFLGGRLRLDVERAERAVASVAEPVSLSVSDAAEAILRIVNSNMQRAIRYVSVQRGHDPQRFTLVSFGGAGGLHACDLAAELNIPRVFVPRHPGVLSAWGCLSADVVKDFAQTVMMDLHEHRAKRWQKLGRHIERLSRNARSDLKREGVSSHDSVLEPSLDMRYAGQSYELTVPFHDNPDRSVEAFQLLHEKRYGHKSPEEPVQAVTVRVRAVGMVAKPALDPIATSKHREPKDAVLAQRPKLTVYDRERLLADHQLTGPALVVEPFSTTRIPSGWQGQVDAWGHLHLTRREA